MVSMKKIGFAILGIITAAALTMPVIAEDGAGKAAGKEGKKGDKLAAFKKADVNADGKLSLEEFKTMVTKGDAEKKFKGADADKDGFVTPEELKAAREKHAKDGKGGDKAGKEAAK